MAHKLNILLLLLKLFLDGIFGHMQKEGCDIICFLLNTNQQKLLLLCGNRLEEVESWPSRKMMAVFQIKVCSGLCLDHSSEDNSTAVESLGDKIHIIWQWIACRGMWECKESRIIPI